MNIITLSGSNILYHKKVNLLNELATAHVSGLNVIIMIMIIIDTLDEVTMTMTIATLKIQVRKLLLFVHKQIDNMAF